MSHARVEPARRVLRRSHVVVEEAAETLVPTNAANKTVRGRLLNQLVPQPLMVWLAVIVRDKLSDRATEMTLAERNQPIEALLRGAETLLRSLQLVLVNDTAETITAQNASIVAWRRRGHRPSWLRWHERQRAMGPVTRARRRES
jgi:hypothetical protein